MQQNNRNPQSIEEAKEMIADLNALVAEMTMEIFSKRQTVYQLEAENESLLDYIRKPEDRFRSQSEDYAWKLPCNAGRLTQAIKVYRVIHGCTLMEAKNAVQAYRNGDR